MTPSKPREQPIGAAGAGLCALCLAPTSGNYGIHRDGFGVGPEVDLCDAHGSGELPSCEQIWDRIAQPAEGEFAHRREELDEAAELIRSLPLSPTTEEKQNG